MCHSASQVRTPNVPKPIYCNGGFAEQQSCYPFIPFVYPLFPLLEKIRTVGRRGALIPTSCSLLQHAFVCLHKQSGWPMAVVGRSILPWQILSTFSSSYHVPTGDGILPVRSEKTDFSTISRAEREHQSIHHQVNLFKLLDLRPLVRESYFFRGRKGPFLAS